LDNIYHTSDKFDRLLIGFILIFIITLTNSIFLNQIGYFGALLILLIQWFRTRKNKFYPTGLELPFVLFLIIELVSALFSINQAQAFTIFFKRLVLIPVVYVVAASADKMDKAKLFLKVFISAAVITVLVYLFVAYRHYIFQLYRLESRGPSVFQYVMTAGGLMSFITVILFAFVVNEKSKWKIKILLVSAFIIAAIGLISSYTRAAWIGAATGIIFILILKKKWIYLTPLVLAFVLLLIFSKKESKIWIYSIKEKHNLLNDFTTNGRAVNLEVYNDFLYVADYEDGVKVVDSTGKIIQKLETEAPVTRIHLWKKNYLLIYLIDSRFKVAEIQADGKIKVLANSLTVGLTRDLEFNNNKFITADFDSGLTVYSNPIELSEKVRLHNEEGIVRIFSDPPYITLYNSKSSMLKLYHWNDRNKLSPIDSVKIVTPTYYVWKFNQFVFFQTDKALLQYKIIENKFSLIKENNTRGIFKTIIRDSVFYSATVDGKINKSRIDKEQDIHFDLIFDVGKNVTDFVISEDQLIISTLKLNRLASVVDPYHETNIERLHLWSTGIKIFLDYPIIGVGDIDLGKIYSEYKPKYVKENYGHLHNNYLHFLVTLGSIGFIIVIFLLYKIFMLNWNIYKKVKNVELASSYALGTLGAYVGFLISGLAEWNFGDQEIITMVWFTIGLNIAFYQSYLKSKTE